MIGSTRQVRVFAFAQPVDLRKGFDGLHALVSQAMQRDALSGDVFLFVSRDRHRAKALYWDGTGLCVFAKRLERGRFTAPWLGKDRPLQLTVSELALFLEGAVLAGRVPLSPRVFEISAPRGS